MFLTAAADVGGYASFWLFKLLLILYFNPADHHFSTAHRIYIVSVDILRLIKLDVERRSKTHSGWLWAVHHRTSP